MKVIRTTLTSLAVLIACTAYSPSVTKQRVYICDSPSAYAYHIDPNCRGLNHCKHAIFTTTKDSAINYYGRRACKICCN